MVSLWTGRVATVLTACGIETICNDKLPVSSSKGCNSAYRLRYWNAPMETILRKFFLKSVATVLTACGIETSPRKRFRRCRYFLVATVLTTCGMRRRVRDRRGAKRWWSPHISSSWLRGRVNEKDRVNVLTVYGIETLLPSYTLFCLHHHCDSTYRLRYWND